MSDYEHLSKAELIARLQALQTVADREQAADEAQHLLHELQVHQIELEMQNRELRETQQALEESRDRYAELYDFAPVGYLTLDPIGRIVDINLTGAALLGRERGRIQGHPFGVFLAPGQNGALLSHLRRTLQHRGEKQVIELRLRSRDETPREIRLESVAAGPDRCRTVLIDVSDIRRAERERGNREIRLRAVLETAADGIIMIDTKGIVQSFNPAAERIFGYAAAEIIGRNVKILMPPPCREEHDGYIRRYRETGEPHVIGIGREVEGRRKDGSVFPLDLAVTEIRDGVPGFTGIVRDISERKQTEAQIRQQQAELSHLSRINLASELAGGIAHELNQPLTAIVTYAQLGQRLLQSADPPRERLEALLTKIVQEGKRIGEIIAELRRLIRKAPPRHTALDLNALIETTLRLADIELRREAIPLQMQLGEALPPVFADAAQIQLVLLNLIHNAAQAMRETAPAERALTLGTRLPDQDATVVEVTVTDTGPGLSPQVAEKLFHPFFTTKAEGMGLGLSLSQSIVEAHQGRLWATPNADRGVTFHLTLPVARFGQNERDDEGNPYTNPGNPQ